jgi:signal transduction histidine kinase
MIDLDMGKTPEERSHLIQLAMICLGVGILTADILLPLGFIIWILYLVPLLMSVWLVSHYVPFITTWLISGAILLGSLISGSLHYESSDLSNRAVFILIIAVVSLLVWEIRSNYAHMEAEVIERRKAQEDLEELTKNLEERIVIRTRELSEVNRDLTEDIKERRKVEAALGTANQKLSLLSSITRHDISNRVFALLAEIDLAKDLSTEPRFIKSLEHLEQTSMAIQDQIAFTKDYQEIGAQAPAWNPVPPLIRNAAAQLDLGEVKITVECDGLEIFSDAMIGKVFYNLIHNAQRHGRHVSRIAFSYQESGNNLVITCEDNGAGIAQQEKEVIFKKGVGKDSGLGLFLIREILSITGITIRESGEPGKGARFDIIVPEGVYRRTHDNQ